MPDCLHPLTWINRIASAILPKPTMTPPTLPVAPEDNDKAKADYQYGLDLAKAAEQSRMTVATMLLDKGCLGFLLAMAAGIGILCTGWLGESWRSKNTHELEAFKLRESQQRFFTEKRLDAVVAVSSAMSEATGAFFSASSPDEKADESKGHAAFDKGLAAVREVVNRHLSLLGREFDEDVSRYIQVLRSIRQLPFKEWQGHRRLVSNLDDEFSNLCRAMLEREKELPRMSLKKIGFAERDGMTPTQYIQAHLEFRKDQGLEDK